MPGRHRFTCNDDSFDQASHADGYRNNPFRYTGQYLDNQIGLYYLRARYYQPGVGRFTTADPFPGYNNKLRSLNDFAYALGNPLPYIDRAENAVPDKDPWPFDDVDTSLLSGQLM